MLCLRAEIKVWMLYLRFGIILHHISFYTTSRSLKTFFLILFINIKLGVKKIKGTNMSFRRRQVTVSHCKLTKTTNDKSWKRRCKIEHKIAKWKVSLEWSLFEYSKFVLFFLAWQNLVNEALKLSDTVLYFLRFIFLIFFCSFVFNNHANMLSRRNAMFLHS